MSAFDSEGSSKRIKSFKNRGKDAEELRRRRTGVTVEIRKTKKDEQMQKKRNVSLGLDVSPLKESNQQKTTHVLPLQDVVQILSSNQCSEADLFNAVQSVRKLLSREKNPPIDTVIKAGLVPRLIDLLATTSNSSIQFEAAWAVTNIVSGTSEQTSVVVSQGGIAIFIKLLASPEANVCEQAIWALGNIAGDGPKFRDKVITNGVLKPLLALVQPYALNFPFLRNVTWTLSNLCRNKNPAPPMQHLAPALPVLADLIHHPDEEVVADACWAISYLTDGSNDRIQMVVDNVPSVIPRLVQLLGDSEVKIVTPALRAIGNIVTGTDEHTQLVIDNGALPYFHGMLCRGKGNLVKEAAWAISNIAAGNQSQISALIEAGLLPHVVNILGNGDFKVQKEAIWIVANFTSGGSPEQVSMLWQAGVIEPLCCLLMKPDAKVVLVVLDALNNILLNAKRLNKIDEVATHIEEHNGLDALEKLQECGNDQIYSASVDIITQFFSGEDVEETGLEPEVSSDVFVFGAAPGFQANQHIHF
eukprot:gene15502-17081_t